MGSTDAEWAAHVTEAWLDPAAPDPWGEIPDRYLTAQGLAVRLIRLIADLRTAGAAAAVIVQEVRARCEEVVAPPDAHDNGT